MFNFFRRAPVAYQPQMQAPPTITGLRARAAVLIEELNQFARDRAVNFADLTAQIDQLQARRTLVELEAAAANRLSMDIASSI